jgi:hypothetical protein
VAGPGVLLWAGWLKVAVGLVFSTFLGFGGGLLFMTLIYRLFFRARPGTVRRWFGGADLLCRLMAFGHGSTTGRSLSGFSLALLLSGILPRFQVPGWVIWLRSDDGRGHGCGRVAHYPHHGIEVDPLQPVRVRR